MLIRQILHHQIFRNQLIPSRKRFHQRAHQKRRHTNSTTHPITLQIISIRAFRIRNAILIQARLHQQLPGATNPAVNLAFRARHTHNLFKLISRHQILTPSQHIIIRIVLKPRQNPVEREIIHSNRNPSRSWIIRLLRRVQKRHLRELRQVLIIQIKRRYNREISGRIARFAVQLIILHVRVVPLLTLRALPRVLTFPALRSVQHVAGALLALQICRVEVVPRLALNTIALEDPAAKRAVCRAVAVDVFRVSRRHVVAIWKRRASESCLVKVRRGVVAFANLGEFIVPGVVRANHVYLNYIAGVLSVIHLVFHRAGEAVCFRWSVAGFAADVAGLAGFRGLIVVVLGLAGVDAGSVE